MKYECIHVSIVEDIATLTLNRPEKRNAMNGVMVRELTEAVHWLATDHHSRVLLLNGEGKHFCAGADIAWMKKMATGSYNDNDDDAQALANLLYQLYSFPKPTIALAHGITLGGGMGLVSACDIALGSMDASFGFPEVKIGLAASTISPYVIAAIGERATHYYFLTGLRFDAKEAYRVGLIHQVIEGEALLNQGIALAKTLLQNSPKALTAAKHLIRQVAKEKITENLAQKTAEHLANIRSSPEAQEGLQAYLEKRDPQWK